MPQHSSHADTATNIETGRYWKLHPCVDCDARRWG